MVEYKKLLNWQKHQFDPKILKIKLAKEQEFEN